MQRDVRRITGADSHEFELFVDAFEDYRASYGYERDRAGTLGFLRERADAEETAVVAAFADDRCVGFALAAKRADVFQRRVSWHVHDVFVDANRRGHGLGRALMETLLASVNAKKTSVTLFAMDDNAVALKLYADLGFVRRDAMGMYILGFDPYRARRRAAERF